MNKFKIIDYNGHSWQIEQIGEEAYSVLCLNPVIAEDDTDYTRWPGDSIISGWVGCPVSFLDSGDHPDYPEVIYEKV